MSAASCDDPIPHIQEPDGRQAQCSVSLDDPAIPCRAKMCVKPFVRLRLRGLPCGSNAGGMADAQHSVSGVSSAHAGRLLMLRGTLARVGPVMMYEEKRLYQCTKCKRG